jgi:hypothetical protein
MDEIRKCSAMSGFICVTKMVHHMQKETGRVMEGTSYEGKGQFYHDPLTLMTCNKTKQYMEDNDLLKYLLLPLEGLQAGTIYHNSIPGNSPELMPLDETLNMDIHSSARYHVAITAHLAKKRPQEVHFLDSKRSMSKALEETAIDAGTMENEEGSGNKRSRVQQNGSTVTRQASHNIGGERVLPRLRQSSTA